MKRQTIEIDAEVEDFDPGAAPKALEGIFYIAGGQRWAIPNESGPGWVQADSTAVRRLLRQRGISSSGERGRNSPLDVATLWIQQNRHVVAACAVAGLPIGLHEIGGRRILVTSERRRVEPRTGRHPVIDGILSGLMPDPPALEHFFRMAERVTAEPGARCFCPGAARRPGRPAWLR